MSAPTTQEIPSNLYKQTAPLQAELIENTKITAEGSNNDVRHLVFSLKNGNYPYLAGQSAGILPPGETEDGKPHKLRLYSIASPGYGDDGNGETLSLCVKRLVYEDEAGTTHYGVCSNYVCDLKVGDVVNMTGPVGKAFLMPEDPNANVIMFATGTGIAPFRGFLHTRYNKLTSATGEYWLFFGAQTRKDYLYHEELDNYAATQPTYKPNLAFSREEQTADGKRMYIQHRLLEKAEEVFALLQQPNTYLYMCGLRGMESGIIEGLEAAAEKAGANWQQVFETLKAEHRWHVEVY